MQNVVVQVPQAQQPGYSGHQPAAQPAYQPQAAYGQAPYPPQQVQPGPQVQAPYPPQQVQTGAQVQAPLPPAATGRDVAEQLKDLNKLRIAGAITDLEFEEQKRRILG